MHLKRLELNGFKSFNKKTELVFDAPISAIVGPNGSGKSNVAEAMRFVLGEQSIKSMRGKRGEDLIFNGSAGASRMGKASVAIIFDNSKREFNVDFDEVDIARVVHRDGVNQYFINKSQVRLKDVIEILSAVHIGASGHHIISQGEADRILSASAKDRRVMIEDALGLKIYQYKKAESERKLEKTAENIKEAESLRREIAPHIKFLQKQVEKIEQARTLREELSREYRAYFKREAFHLSHVKQALANEKTPLADEIKTLEKSLEHAREKAAEGKDAAAINRLVFLEGELARANEEKDMLSRKLGRLEGMIEYAEKMRAKETRAREGAVISLNSVKSLYEEIAAPLAEAGASSDIEHIRGFLKKIKDSFASFFAREEGQHNIADGEEEDSAVRLKEKDALVKDIAKEEGVIAGLVSEHARLKKEIESKETLSRDAERKVFEYLSALGEKRMSLQALAGKEETLSLEEEDFKRELGEAGALLGRAIVAYEHEQIDTSEMTGEDRTLQKERRKHIEKMKVRVEDMGGSSGEDIMKEYTETSERDQYLMRELSDLHTSSESLRHLIDDLSQQIDEKFKTGITKINAQFQEFFALMFGGGRAALSLVIEKKKKNIDESLDIDDVSALEFEEEKEEAGIDIAVSLPHKKIKGLQMLSGGERALTSIALLFAVSQVNPPPFLVLDETDAALDEANSRKYGDMLENLAKYSQLIVITHNRETMSRAGILYGVTMGSDATSKLLSIKFDEAVQIAK
ncbi:MAG: AAA family ATPase [Parcubacteria group bacterium]|nr:AAA family ATPase [Parcubacteria group bacterium]